MRIQLTTDRVGPMCTDTAGDEIDVPIEEARRLIDSGQAIAVGELRTAVTTTVETTMLTPPPAPTGRPQPKARNTRNAK